MTIKEIKDYIDNQVKVLKEFEYTDQTIIVMSVIQSFEDVKLMLEALEIEQGITVINEQLPQKGEYIK